MQYYVNLSSANNLATFRQLAKTDNSRASMSSVGLARGKRTCGEALETLTKSPPASDFQQPASVRQQRPTAPNQLSESLKFHSLTSERADKETGWRAPAHSPEPTERPFDLIIFAASGSVGRFLVEELALVVEKYHSSGSSEATGASAASSDQFAQHQPRRRSVPSSSKGAHHLRWAVAGRSAVRLSETLCRAELSTGIKDLSRSIPVVLADLTHQRSLVGMCKRAKVVVNCAGPYSSLDAELLIQTCIECRTNYIDLAHEATFVESIHAKYSERARRRGVFILNGCGFQSMSAEMGLNFTKQVADGRIEQVKVILSLSATKSLVGLPSTIGAGSSCPQRQRRRQQCRKHTSGIVSEGMWNSLLTEKAQEISLKERLRARSADDHEEAHGRRQSVASMRIEEADELELERKPMVSEAGAPLRSNWDDPKPSPPSKVLARKDTRSLVMDIVQFRNRNMALTAWPRQLLKNFQGPRGRGYCWPIDMLTGDESQLIRGEMNHYELRRPDLESADGSWRPIRCSTFLSVRNFTQLCLLSVWLFLFQILVKFSLARYLMRKMPQVASLGHVVTSRGSNLWFNLVGGRRQVALSPSEDQLDRDSLSHIKYCQTFIAYGTPSEESGNPLEDRREHVQTQQLLVARLVGPEPNHVASATFAVQAALTLLMERDHLPSSGGVLTPGAAFSETNIIYQLRRRNIKFEVLKKA